VSTLRYMAAMFGPSVVYVFLFWAYTVIAGIQP
jgi:hypothetical protein